MLKQLLYKAFVAFDPFPFFLNLNRSRILILMYHRFSQGMEPFKISNNTFERQINFLKKNFNVISMSDYVRFTQNDRNRMPNNPVIITIDDGYRDFYEVAYPVLKKYETPATLFIVTDFISYGRWLWFNKLEYILKNSKRKTFEFPLGSEVQAFRVDDFRNWHSTQLSLFHHCRSLDDEEKDQYLKDLAKFLGVDVPEKTTRGFLPVDWAHVVEMSQNGIEIGSHTCSHPILTRVPRDRLEIELSHSKREIEERLGIEAVHFCYPNGSEEDFDIESINLLKQLSYTSAVTVLPGYNKRRRQDMFRLNRISLNNDRLHEIKYLLARHMFHA